MDAMEKSREADVVQTKQQRVYLRGGGEDLGGTHAVDDWVHSLQERKDGQTGDRGTANGGRTAQQRAAQQHCAVSVESRTRLTTTAETWPITLLCYPS